MRISLAIFSGLAAVMLGGCATIEYGPLDGEATPMYGYRESLTREGEYVLTIQAFGGSPETVHAMWDRRARELCGHPGFQKKLYRAERPTATYGSSGGMPGNMILEGFLFCAPAVATAAGEAGS
jgi:hypothetical protein